MQIFCFIATLAAGRVTRSVPMLFAFGSLVIFVLGGLTGVMVALAPFDFQAHDTFFVVGHLHYVLIGGAIFPILAGLLLLLSARQRQEALRPAGEDRLLADVHRLQRRLPADAPDGTARNAAARLHLSGGHRASTRSISFRPSARSSWRRASPSSSGTSFARRGSSRISERNPWNAGTLEWLQEMPGKPWGIRSIPEIDSRYPLWDQPNFVRDVDEGRFYLPDAEEGKRETIVTSVIDAQPHAMPAAARVELHHAAGPR